MKFSRFLATAFATSLCFTPAAFADDQQQNGQNDKAAKNQQQSNNDANYRVSPSGWIRMAVDYDNDGTFDAIETIYTYDLEKARKSSRDRANREAQKSSAGSQSSGQEMADKSDRNGQRSANNQQQETVTGEILQMRTEKLSGMDEPVVLVRIRTEDNWPAKAVLGPKSKLKKLKLAEGDQVTISGRKGRVNDKSMLLASKVKSDGSEVLVDMPSSRGTKRVKAELLSKRTVNFRSHDETFVVARVRCANGEKEFVNLGAKSKVDQLNLSEGDELRMIVRPAKINGEPAMVADEVMAGGKTVKVSPPKRIAKRMRNQNQEQAQSKKQGQSENRSADDEAAVGIAIGETGEGVVILAIHPDGPAADEDVQVGDTIVSINGDSVDSPESLIKSIREMQPDERIKLKVRRDGDEQDVQIRLTSRQSMLTTLR